MELPRILLVENSKTQAAMIEGFLTQPGWDARVRTVGSLAEGLKALAEADSELVLLDLNLPDSTGLDTYLRMRAADALIPIVILTAEEHEESSVRAIKAGAQDYLFKSQLNEGVVRRAVLFAQERQRQFTALMAELDTLRDLAHGVLEAPRTADEAFFTHQQEYKHLLKEAAAWRHDHDTLASFAARLVSEGRSAGFAIELHYATVMELISEDRRNYQVAGRSGRFLLVELLGLMLNKKRG